MKACYICLDTGVVQYKKVVDKIEYEFYAACGCGFGTAWRGKSTRIPSIKQIFDDKTLKSIWNKNKEFYAPNHGEKLNIEALKKELGGAANA